MFLYFEFGRWNSSSKGWNKAQWQNAESPPNQNLGTDGGQSANVAGCDPINVGLGGNKSVSRRLLRLQGNTLTLRGPPSINRSFSSPSEASLFLVSRGHLRLLLEKTCRANNYAKRGGSERRVVMKVTCWRRFPIVIEGHLVRFRKIRMQVRKGIISAYKAIPKNGEIILRCIKATY